MAENAGGGGGKATTPKAPAPPPPKQVWYFNGKVYFTLAAYQAAVAAAQAAAKAAAQAKAAAAAKAAAEQRVLQQQQAAKKRAALRAADLAAAQLATAKERERLRIEANQKAAQQQLAQDVARRKREALELSLKNQALREADQRALKVQQQLATDRELQRLRQTQNLIRQSSWANLQEANARVVERLKAEASGYLGVTGGRSHGFFEGVDPGAVVHSDDSQRTDVQVRIGQETGDWSGAVALAESQSRQSGGMYVDPALMGAIDEQLVAPAVAVQNAFFAGMEPVNAAMEAGDVQGAIDLYYDPDFQKIVEQYTRLFGDPDTGEGGSFTPLGEKLNQIAKDGQAAWMRQVVGLPPGASDSAVRAVLQRAVEAAPRDVRGGFTEFADGRNPRMDLYVSMLSREQQHRIEVLKQKRRADLKLSRDEGYTNVRYQGGRLQYTNPYVEGLLKQTAQWVPNAASRLAAIESAASNPGVQNQLIRDFMGELSAAWDRNHASGVGLPAFGSDRGALMGYLSADTLRSGRLQGLSGQSKHQFLDQFARYFLPGRDQSGWSTSDQIGATFGGQAFGGITGAPLATFAFMIGAVRYGIQSDLVQNLIPGGRPTEDGAWEPYVNIRFSFGPTGEYHPGLDLNFWGFIGLGVEVGRVYDENAGEARRIFEDALTSGNLEQLGEGLREYQDWGAGNLGGLLTGVTDPFQFMGLGVLSRSTKLAWAANDGVRGVTSGRFIADVLKMSRPARLGGVGKDAMELAFGRLKRAQALGIPWSEVKNLSDDAWRELDSLYLRGSGGLKVTAGTAEELKPLQSKIKDEYLANLPISDELKQALKGSILQNPEQLMSRIQEVIPKIAREYGVHALTAPRVRRLLAAADQGIVTARAERSAATALVRDESRHAASLKTLADVRRALGRPQTAAKQTTAAARSRFNTLLQTYVGATDDYLKAATRAKDAADTIRTLGTTAGIDGRRLQTATAQLRRAVRDMRAFDENLATGIGTHVGSARQGLVSKAWDDFATWRKSIGGDPSLPARADLEIGRLRIDKRLLDSRIRGIRRSLAGTTDPQKIKGLRRMLDEARTAREGLEFEYEVFSRRPMVRAFAQKEKARIAGAVRPQRLGQLATNPMQRALETGRSLMARRGQITKRFRERSLSAEQRVSLDAAKEHMRQTNVSALLRKRGLDWGPDVSLEEALYAFNKVMRDPVRKLEYADIWADLERAAKVSLYDVGRWKMTWGSLGTVLGDILPTEHVRLGARALSLDEYARLDQKVADALFAVRGRRAEGVVRKAGKKARARLPSPDMLMRADSDPEWVMAKIRALREEGVDLFQYDATRGVLGDVLVRKRSMESILEQAKREAAKTGEDLDGAFLRIREERAAKESLREFEEWMQRPDMADLSPAQGLEMFEEDYIGRDLGRLPELNVSRYQEETLQRAFLGEMGFTMDDEHLVRKFFAGIEGELPKGARLPKPGEFMVFEEIADGSAQIYVVAKNHPKMTQPPAWARWRPAKKGADELLAGGDAEAQARLADFQLQHPSKYKIDPSLAGEDVVAKDPLAKATKAEWDRNRVRITRSDRLDEASDNFYSEDLDRLAADEEVLSEAEAAKRGADAGRRQNPAQEARRSSRRNFEPLDQTEARQAKEAGPVRSESLKDYMKREEQEALFGRGVSDEDYPRWLWNRVRSDPDLRLRLRRMANLRTVPGTGPKAYTLARAVGWLNSAEGLARYPKAAKLIREGQDGLTDTARAWREALLAEQAKLTKLRSEARGLAGQQFAARVQKAWLWDVLADLEPDLAVSGFYHSGGVRNEAEQAAEEILRILGVTYKEGDLNDVVSRLLKQGKELHQARALRRATKDAAKAKALDKRIAWLRWQRVLAGNTEQLVPVARLRKLRDLAARDGRTANAQVLDDQLRDLAKELKGWINRGEQATDNIARGADAAKWERIADRADVRLEEIAAELRGGFKGRRRGSQGLSVQGDGIYIAEGTSNTTIAHELFHQFWDSPYNDQWRREIEKAVDDLGDSVQRQIWTLISVNLDDALSVEEITAELYALWRMGDNIGSDVLYSWNEVRGLLRGSVERDMFDELGRTFGSWKPKVEQVGLADLRVPPIHNRGALTDWLVQNGYWSRRTGEQIARGERVWSLAEERSFFKNNFGFEPVWTNESVLKPLLSDQAALRAAMMEWGYQDNGFEQLVARSDLKGQQLQQALAWGADGIPRARTWGELRRYARERYGDLVYDGNKMTSMPWLMKADDEYLDWLGEALDEAGKELLRGTRRADWEAVYDLLPRSIRDAYFEPGGVLKRAGLDFERGLIKAGEVDSLTKAITNATRRRIERMMKAGDLDPATWLAEEQVRFAYDVAAELMTYRGWRLRLGISPLANGLGIWSSVFRALVSFQPAFPIMNLIDAFGFKRFYLAIFENRGRFLAGDADGMRLVPNLGIVGGESASVFGLDAGVEFFGRVRNRNLSFGRRVTGAIQDVLDTPLKISEYGENSLRLDFVQSVAGDVYRSAVKSGMALENAEMLARAESKRLLGVFFAKAPDVAWRNALDQVIPFFNYNWRNKTLAVRAMADHPILIYWGEKLASWMRDQNREMWERDHPDIPFPEDQPSASWFWFKVGDTEYRVDLTAFSDWTRAYQNILQPHSVVDMVAEFVRVGNSQQWAVLSALLKIPTPWGKPGDWREVSPWLDFVMWATGKDYDNPDDQRDAIQMASQMLFFKKFATVSPIKITQMTYFAIRERNPEAAAKFLDEHPELLAYWQAKNPDATRGADPSKRPNRYAMLTDAERDLFGRSMSAWQRIQKALDEKIARYASDPWSPEYKAAKEEARLVRLKFMHDHPEIADYFAVNMSAADFARQSIPLITDGLVEAFFSIPKPKRDAFDDERAYQEAMVEYYDDRERYLRVHPSVMDALYSSRSSVERAWKDQELQWSEILQTQARIKIAILDEEAKGATADRDLIDQLYGLRHGFQMELENGVWGTFSNVDAELRRDMRAAGSWVVKAVARVPGFRDFVYSRATPAQQAKMDEDQRYFRGIQRVVKASNSGKEFYELLRQDPWLLKQYWERNPDKKREYEANQAYVGWMGQWVERLKVNDFKGAQAVWDQMPKWVKDRYFAKHPDSKMRDGSGYASGGGAGFSSPEARTRFEQGQAYYAAMGTWVELLKAKEYVKADAYFRSLPDWMKEKYYQKHPDQRAKNELESAVLRAGAEYFLATGADKLKILQAHPELRDWLNAHGGDEAAFRGLINAIYRSIPSKEAWLRRTFREAFPEIFSVEAQGERRLASVARSLAEHPEVLPFYEEAVKLQYHLWLEQLKRSKVAPDPWVLERPKSLKDRRKRRAARLSSLWTLHRDLRRHRDPVGRHGNRP